MRTSQQCKEDADIIANSIKNLASYKEDLEKQMFVVETIINNKEKTKEEIYKMFDDVNEKIVLNGVCDRTIMKIINLYYNDPQAFMETYYSVSNKLAEKTELWKKTIVLMKKRKIEEEFGMTPKSRKRKTQAEKVNEQLKKIK